MCPDPGNQTPRALDDTHGETTMKKIVLAAGLATMAAGSAHAATATGSATATIIAPLQIAHNSGAALSFGTFTAGTGGSVSVTAAGVGTPSGDVAIVAGSSYAADAFTVTGSGTRTFNIATSSGNTVSTGGATPATMPFTLTALPSASLVGGTYTLNVGGTLNVASGQAAGAYTGTYTVTVTYQ